MRWAPARAIRSCAPVTDVLDRQRLLPRVRHDLIRLGPPKDGGYVVPAEAVERTTVLLSLGMKDDWSFETAFVAARGTARVIGVDPSVGPGFFARQIVGSAAGIMKAVASGRRRQRARDVATLRNAFDYFWFFRVRHRHIGKLVAASEGEGHVTLDGLMALAGDSDHRVFLKMDIEGSEYALTAGILRYHQRINCVVVEFHRVGKSIERFNEAIAVLQQQFQIVHVHGNNYRPYDTRYDFPDTVEITLLHRDLMSESAPAVSWAYPRPGLDFPNLPSRPDHRLRFD
jgi:hypothetical protein